MSVTLHTNVGDLKLELFCDRCPRTCENFLALCASSYYDGVAFHRNVREFVIQGGDPTGTGKGGQSIWGKPFDDEIFSDLSHNKRGIVSMANSGKDKNKSQFFVTYAPLASLDGRFPVFGHVIHGFDTLDALEAAGGEAEQKPRSETRILRVTIHANPIAEQV